MPDVVDEEPPPVVIAARWGPVNCRVFADRYVAGHR
jgi:hypothetical protein